MAHVSPQRLARFFTRSEHGYQIAKDIRDLCVFARHNLAQDPPFSKLDLISCCNVLIYLGDVLQRKVWSILQYALKPTGFLVLGPSESIGALSDSFHQVEKSHKIYCLRAAASYPGAAAKRRPPNRRPGGSPRENCRGRNRAGRAAGSRPAGAGRICPSGRHHRQQDEHRRGAGPHRSVPGAFAWRADPESFETGARRLDCGPGKGHPQLPGKRTP